MVAPAPKRVATFVRAEGFQDSYDDCLKRLPKIREKLGVFMAAKAKRPPDPLPSGFRDHRLHGRLSDFSEYHLDGDACLIYQDAVGKVTLLRIVTHDEMKGPRAKKLAISLGRILRSRI